MTAVSRALLLCVPLILFAGAGALYTPFVGQPDEDGDIALSSLPPLPAWAAAPLPDFSVIRDTTERKAAFFSFLFPRIVLANSRILIERHYLETLRAKSELTEAERQWLAAHATRLRIDEAIGSDAQFALLEKRIGVIPPSLILAQAANESAWGTSRFATKGNNLFGQWCFSKGCGLVPLSRAAGASHEVASFASPYGSIRAYMTNLNRHPTYQLVRNLRQQSFQTNQPLSGVVLAGGLLGYSERGEDYVKEIRAMIRYNNLEFFDKQFQALIADQSPEHLLELATAPNAAALLPRNRGTSSTEQ
ncbi:glucosaminidase domain-containing protein [Marinobacter litoralis]|uniref:glucosaminidase domain-containing protein n=1 Tax=Marinobacter litoralis TaxID=187981 RepID=UPI0018EAF45D|nr:glucosaminidase domain-containing protein [Marinobacter litoralis]MBJ6137302.1 glucosaminidase domain-containing protein [Marinobacter litoralis]